MENVPINEHIIERVESLAEVENQTIVHQGYPNFERAHGELINDKVDEEIPQETLIGHVYGNTDSAKNEVQDIIVKEEDI